MKATEAIELTIDNAKKIEWFREEIESRAKLGCNFIIFDQFYITIDIFSKLMADGYQISQGVNPFGVNWLRVQW